jgi:hypothetical protein
VFLLRNDIGRDHSQSMSDFANPARFDTGFRVRSLPGLKKRPVRRIASGDLGAPVTQVRDVWPIPSIPLAGHAIRRRFPR